MSLFISVHVKELIKIFPEIPLGIGGNYENIVELV